MKRSLLLLVALFSIPVTAQAGPKHFKELHVADLASLMKSNPPTLALYDVNVESTRTHVGIIPGSKLLSSSASFDAASELPKDKNARLVFYCANTMCTASHAAAERTLRLGYKDVSVMVDGVYGWKKAGEPLVPVSGKSPSSLDPKTVSALTELHAAVIVDVREGEERHEVIQNAQWWPMSRGQEADAWSQLEAQLPKDKLVIFHCAAGVRAKRAAEKLAADGYKTAYFKGPDEWRNAGLPLAKGTAE